jgi:hypothetical protein
MWQSLFFDLFAGLCQSPKDLSEAVVLAVHLFNVSRDLQCTGLSENDPQGYEILPKAWNLNQQLFSFRYSSGELQVYQKFLRINEEKLNIYTIRSDRNDKIINFSVDLTVINCQLQGEEFTKELVEKVLREYESQVLTALEISRDEKVLKDEEESKDLNAFTRQKSLLEDDSVPFGQPIHPLSEKGIHVHSVHEGSSPYFHQPLPSYPSHPAFHPHPYYLPPYHYGLHYSHPFHPMPPVVPSSERQLKKSEKKGKKVETPTFSGFYPSPYYPGFF